MTTESHRASFGSIAPGLRLYRVCLAILGGLSLLLFIPVINLLALLGMAIAALVAFGGLISMVNGAPAGAQLGRPLAGSFGFGIAAVIAAVNAFPRSYYYYGTNHGLLIVAAALGFASTWMHFSFWMGAAHSLGAQRAADRFRAPFVIALISSPVLLFATAVHMPSPLVWLLQTSASLVSFVTFWSATNALLQAAEFGVNDDD